MEIAVQVCGKIKARVTVPADADEKAVQAVALANPSVAAALRGGTIRNVIVVPKRLVNIVIS